MKPIPYSICRKIIEGKHVNLIDFIDDKTLNIRMVIAKRENNVVYIELFTENTLDYSIRYSVDIPYVYGYGISRCLMYDHSYGKVVDLEILSKKIDGVFNDVSNTYKNPTKSKEIG